MMETLGTLCDKLIVIELKIHHADDKSKKLNLENQRVRIMLEINSYVTKVVSGKIVPDDITFESNKVYNKKITFPKFTGELGELISSLAHVNCTLWHEVDKGYNTENMSGEELKHLVKQLAVLNLERNHCIDAINSQFKGQVML